MGQGQIQTAIYIDRRSHPRGAGSTNGSTNEVVEALFSWVLRASSPLSRIRGRVPLPRQIWEPLPME
jgi:hypothetical protein